MKDTIFNALEKGWARNQDIINKGRNAMSFSKDDILDAMGLQQQTVGSWLGPAAIGFGMGAVIGATIAFMFAPRPGVELREDLFEKGKKMVERGKETVESYTGSMGSRPTTPTT